MVDLDRHRHRHLLGAYLHFRYGLTLHLHPSTVEPATNRQIHGSDACIEVSHYDKRHYRLLHLHPSHQSRLEVADAQDGEARRHLLLRPWCSVSLKSHPFQLIIMVDNCSCVVIGIVRFWQIFVIDLIGNLTGTSLTTFMLVTMELVLAGLCINIPMLRPFYTHWTNESKSSHGSSHGKANYDTSDSGVIAECQGGTQGHAAWIELVRHPDIQKVSLTLTD
jgi:hypothetical protein